MSTPLTQPQPTAAPGAADQIIKAYLSEIGRRGGQVGGKKGFAAMPARQAREIRKKSAEKRSQRSKERAAAAAAAKVA